MFRMMCVFVFETFARFVEEEEEYKMWGSDEDSAHQHTVCDYDEEEFDNGEDEEGIVHTNTPATREPSG